jgi:hypothetical protein
MHYSDYQRFESEMSDAHPVVRDTARHIDQLTAAGDQVPEEIRDIINQLRNEPKYLAALQVDGFWDYLKWAATEGVTIAEVGKGGNGLNLGYFGTFIYWSVEALILAAIAFIMMRKAAARPFCLDCDAWKTEKILLESTQDHNPIFEAVRQGDLDALEKTLTTIDSRKPKANQFTRISTYICDHCGTDQTIEVKAAKMVVNNGTPGESKLIVLSYPGESLESLNALAVRVMHRA